MKIARLRAERVHGYLPLDVGFFDDLTFLTGLNGSGKTSALRLLMALLTPNLDELGSIVFDSAEVTVHEGADEIVVKAVRRSDAIAVSVSSMADVLEFGLSDIDPHPDSRRHDEARSTLLERHQQHPIVQRLRAISTPMFLGLDRRFFAPGSFGDEVSEARRREYFARRYWQDESPQRSSGPVTLLEINYLVVTKLQAIRAAQEQLDETLRSQFFTKAFEYKPSDLLDEPAKFPSRSEIDKYRLQLANIEKAAEGVKIPVPEIQSAMTHFFERMSAVVDALEKSVPIRSGRRKGRRSGEGNETPGREYFEWLVNRPQADRILEHLKLLDDYIQRRNALRDPVSRFLALVNGFLEQTQKTVSVTQAGQLAVQLSPGSATRSVSALSSGERQLVIMLGHLSLNPNLAGSGVFIVDEPELSLHIDWQEKFVDAIREANPSVQLILATHSPAIILDRIDNCQTLSVARHA